MMTQVDRDQRRAEVLARIDADPERHAARAGLDLTGADLGNPDQRARIVRQIYSRLFRPGSSMSEAHRPAPAGTPWIPPSGPEDQAARAATARARQARARATLARQRSER